MPVPAWPAGDPQVRLDRTGNGTHFQYRLWRVAMFFLPLYDDNPTRCPAVVTAAVIFACALIFVWQLSLAPREEVAAVYSLGVIPAVLWGYADLPPSIAMVPPWASVVTSMFLHGGFFHLGGNMLYLWIFGNNVEDAMGRGRFVVFYLLCGAIAAMVQSLMLPSSEAPMIGASGAVAGVLGAYLVLHPRANVRVLVWIVIIVTVVNVPALVVLGAWFAGQLVHGLAMPAAAGGVAVWAHIGGFLAGVVLIPFFKRREIALMQPAHTQPFATMPPALVFRSRGSVPEVRRLR
jgi:membrane associated rhomboid family serine protease